MLHHIDILFMYNTRHMTLNNGLLRIRFLLNQITLISLRRLYCPSRDLYPVCCFKVCLTDSRLKDQIPRLHICLCYTLCYCNFTGWIDLLFDRKN